MEKLFLNKRTYIGTDGDEYINMCIPSLSVEKLQANSLSLLRQDHNGRLDRFVYESVSVDVDNGMDLTLYCNHIFNPFAVQEGDIIYTPIDSLKVWEKQSEPELPDGTTYSSKSQNKKQMTYAERVEYLARMGFGVG